MFRKKLYHKKHKGIAPLVAMLFVMVFSALSVAMFSMSSGNSLVASNLHKVNEARSCAESGLEVIRYYLQHDDTTIYGEIKDDLLRFAKLAEKLEALDQGFDATDDSMMINFGLAGSPVGLNSDSSNNFYAQLTPNGDGVDITITGTADQIKRKIESGFNYGIRKKSAFDFGVATKGPLALTKISMDGVNRVDSDVYIESFSEGFPELNISNSQIAGDVHIVNPNGDVESTGKFSIGGETGDDALQNHIEFGVDETEFPLPNTSHFEQFVNGIIIDSNNIDSYNANATLENVRIAANTNPTFDGQTTINGVMYIEQPNVVTFGGTANVTGIIIGNGDMSDNSGDNQLNFAGSVVSSSVEALPQTEQFAGLHDETGTFLMAPGFAVSMAGNFGTLNGCIVANGVDMVGSAEGTIGGSIINYSTELMTLGGKDLLFNRSGITDIPAGLVLEIVMHYDPSAYDEVLY